MQEFPDSREGNDRLAKAAVQEDCRCRMVQYELRGVPLISMWMVFHEALPSLYSGHGFPFTAAMPSHSTPSLTRPRLTRT